MKTVNAENTFYYEGGKCGKKQEFLSEEDGKCRKVKEFLLDEKK